MYLRALTATTLAGLVLAGCGEEEGLREQREAVGDPAAARQISALWTQFRAAAAKADAKALCGELLSERAQNNEAAIAGSCARAIRREPVYTKPIGPLEAVRVNKGAGAAAGDWRHTGDKRPVTVQLILEDGAWRVNQLFRRYGQTER